MAEPISVTKVGNALVIRMDDGVEWRALPVGSAVWQVAEFYSEGDGGTEPDPDPTPDPDPGTSVFRWPFRKSQMTTYSGHSGGDWGGGAVGNTANVKAIGPGVVEEVYDYPYNTYPEDSSEPEWRGRCIVINHGTIDGHEIWSLYAHMRDAPTLSKGDTVTGGQVIGRVGNTGYSNGSHLHFEVIYDGVRLRTGQGGYERMVAWMDAHAVGTW